MIIMPHSRPGHRCSSQARQPSDTPQVSRSRPLQQIPAADVLAFTVHVLESRSTMLGERIEIASDAISAEQAAGTIARLAGRPVWIWVASRKVEMSTS